MSNPLTIGDTNRDGMLRIIDTNWDFNGTLRVTVEDTLGARCRIGGLDIRAMRRLARRAIAHPELTRSSRAIRFEETRAGTSIVTFAISRNKPY